MGGQPLQRIVLAQHIVQQDDRLAFFAVPPIDESPYGVYDMCGSAAEWMDDWFRKDNNERRLGGSSWGMTDPELFDVWGGMSAAPNVATYNFGFRLIFRGEK